MDTGALDRAISILKALSHPTRLRLVALLRPGGLYVCQAAAILEFPVSTVSEHLSELKRAGLVAERRDGRWVSYSLAGTPEVKVLLEGAWKLAASDAQLRWDARVARAVRRLSPTDLCEAGLDLTRFGLESAREA